MILSEEIVGIRGTGIGSLRDSQISYKAVPLAGNWNR